MPDPNPLRDPETRERLLAEARAAAEEAWWADAAEVQCDLGSSLDDSAHIANWSPALAIAALELIGELEAQLDQAMPWTPFSHDEEPPR